ncbi:hypothetical protein SHJG_7633 [Streptomyces hygroscopicus subsp. jinggangensis 5008]|nr:hypothetical protein SHJG_7633 [Streptomyces hygroscopicus subsp. jinggangensis 5008]AGF67056.1 hypothetical protein SHJGH_7394 [Streptomyces hygroscopicus subsp. jinggangensis TL01]
MHQEHAGAHLRRVLDVVPLGPQRGPVAAAGAAVGELSLSYQEEIALIGTIVRRPLTPVAATPLAMVPSQLLPIMPVLPLVQPAVTGVPPVRLV